MNKTIIDFLIEWAEKKPDFLQFTYHDFDKNTQASLTTGELYQKAKCIAQVLKNMAKPQSRIVLIFEPGLPFIYSLLGCLMAGMVAVPTMMPKEMNQAKSIQDFFDQTDASVILTNEELLLELNFFINLFIPDLNIPCLGVEGFDFSQNQNTFINEAKPNDLAYLQYTSGSIRSPKAVEITHANLISEIKLLNKLFKVKEVEKMCFWLPHTHNMGLVGGIFVPIFNQFVMHLMSPFQFLEVPFRWLKLISDYKLTASAGNSGAYDLCVKSISPEQKKELDLSSWKMAAVGGEYIRKNTLEQFYHDFAPCGFKMESFGPGYGLAEATMMVAGNSGESLPEFMEFSLKKEGSITNPEGSFVKICTSVGPILNDNENKILIVNPDTLQEVEEGSEGEIWVAGPHVSRGYWKNPEQTAETFGAHLSNGDKKTSFLRTGDLGVISKGRLYITGRRKEIIIIRGINHYPEDIEWSAKNAHPIINGCNNAAFAVEVEDHEELVVIQELPQDYDHNLKFDEVIGSIRERIVKENQIVPYKIALVHPHTLQKTHSGKTQRLKTRDVFLNNNLFLIAEWHRQLESIKPFSEVQKNIKSDYESILTLLKVHVAEEAKIEIDKIDVEKSFDFYGIDSLSSVRIFAELQIFLNRDIPIQIMEESKSIKSFAKNINNLLQNTDKNQIESLVNIPQISLKSISEDVYNVRLFPENQELMNKFKLLEHLGVDQPYFREDEGIITNQTMIKDQPYINYSTYNYLGLTNHPEVVAAAKNAIDKYGTSVSGSRLCSGQKPIHTQLENEIAKFLGTDDAMVFVGGHTTNESTIGHLLKHQDLILCDSLIHNSLYQGSLLSHAKILSFAHNNVMELEELLKKYRTQYRRCLIVIEGIYSMEGDIANVPEIIELKKKYKCLLMIDEAHSIGVLGKTGRGVSEFFNLDPNQVDIWMGTLSKSFASCGGYISGNKDFIKFLKFTTPGFVYAAGMSPANCAAALAAIKVTQNEPERIERLHERSDLFRKLARQAGLNMSLSDGTGIVPIIIGDTEKCFLLADQLFKRKINVHPITYPVVPKNTDRLRFFLSSEHTEEEIKQTIKILKEELDRLER